MNDAEWDSMVDINYVSNYQAIVQSFFPYTFNDNSDISLTKYVFYDM